MRVWVICTMLFGTPIPMDNSPEFTNESACIIYMAGLRLGPAQSAFKMGCMEKTVSKGATDESQ